MLTFLALCCSWKYSKPLLHRCASFLALKLDGGMVFKTGCGWLKLDGGMVFKVQHTKLLKKESFYPLP